MSTEQFLSRAAFDDIIASLEALLLEVQNLVASVDPLNDPQVIADIQTVADQLAEILTVAGISGDITTVAGESANIAIIADNITQIQSIVDELQAILAVAAELPAIQTVANDTAAVNTVAGSIAAVQEVADNMQAVIDAVQAAQDAADARDKAEEWAVNPEDVPVETSPDRYSSLHYASKAAELYDMISGLSNFVGEWSNLAGSLNSGSVVYHNGEFWFLLVDLPDVTASEPTPDNEDWRLLAATILEQSLFAYADYYDQGDWSVGAGETTLPIGFDGNILVGLNGSWLFGGWTQSGDDLIIEAELQAGDTVAVLKLTDSISISQVAGIEIEDPAEGDLLRYAGEAWKNVSFPELIFSRQKQVYTKDFMPFEGREQVEGSASIVQDISGFNYFKQIQTGDVSDSRARLSNPLRHGLFRLPEVNGRQSIDFTKRIQFIQHISMRNWAEGSEITCSFGRSLNADSDSGQRMFGFVIKGATPMLHLMTNDGQATPAEVQADNIPYGANFLVSTICMDFYPGEAFVLTLNGVEYELTSQLPTGVRVNTTPGIWDVTNGTNDEDIRFEIYRNEVTVTP